jgi:hypothetical protein
MLVLFLPQHPITAGIGDRADVSEIFCQDNRIWCERGACRMIRMILARLLRQRDTYVRIIESIQKYTFVFTALAIWLTCVPANAERTHFAPVRLLLRGGRDTSKPRPVGKRLPLHDNDCKQL